MTFILLLVFRQQNFAKAFFSNLSYYGTVKRIGQGNPAGACGRPWPILFTVPVVTCHKAARDSIEEGLSRAFPLPCLATSLELYPDGSKVYTTWNLMDLEEIDFVRTRLVGLLRCSRVNTTWEYHLMFAEHHQSPFSSRNRIDHLTYQSHSVQFWSLRFLSHLFQFQLFLAMTYLALV